MVFSVQETIVALPGKPDDYRVYYAAGCQYIEAHYDVNYFILFLYFLLAIGIVYTAYYSKTRSNNSVVVNCRGNNVV